MRRPSRPALEAARKGAKAKREREREGKQKKKRKREKGSED